MNWKWDVCKIEGVLVTKNWVHALRQVLPCARLSLSPASCSDSLSLVLLRWCLCPLCLRLCLFSFPRGTWTPTYTALWPWVESTGKLKGIRQWSWQMLDAILKLNSQTNRTSVSRIYSFVQNIFIPIRVAVDLEDTLEEICIQRKAPAHVFTLATLSYSLKTLAFRQKKRAALSELTSSMIDS